jgi:PAS domain S-box-containing protein
MDWRAVVESLPDVVYALDLDGRFTYLNPRAHEVFGYSVEEGKAFRRLMTRLGSRRRAELAAHALRLGVA